jgi:hypothetical protein
VSTTARAAKFAEWHNMAQGIRAQVPPRPALSFAKFEREVIGERIRDKFAASCNKGMRMGSWIDLKTGSPKSAGPEKNSRQRTKPVCCRGSLVFRSMQKALRYLPFLRGTQAAESIVEREFG